MLQSRTLRLLRLELLTALENFILPPWKRKGRGVLLERLYPPEGGGANESVEPTCLQVQLESAQQKIPLCCRTIPRSPVCLLCHTAETTTCRRICSWQAMLQTVACLMSISLEVPGSSQYLQQHLEIM